MPYLLKLAFGTLQQIKLINQSYMNEMPHTIYYRDQPGFSVFKHSMDDKEGV